jgi:hypothetical protein
MQPAKAVSPEAAALLPPVGLLSQSRTPPPLAPTGPAEPPSTAARAMPAEVASSPRPSAASSPTPLVAPSRHVEAQKKWVASGSSSTAWTVTMVLTAVGVGAMAIIPALSGGGDKPSEVVESPEPSGSPREERGPEAPPRVRVAGREANGTHSASASPRPDLEREAILASELAEIRRLLRERDTAAAAGRIDQLAAQAWPPTLRSRIEQYSALVSANEVLLANLQSALDQTGAGHAIRWRGRETPIVGVTDRTVTILVARRQVRLPRHSLSNEAVRALAEGLLDMNDPRNQAQLGAFLFVTEEGDHSQARRLWGQAAAAGEDVSHFLRLLQPPR